MLSTIFDSYINYSYNMNVKLNLIIYCGAYLIPFYSNVIFICTKTTPYQLYLVNQPKRDTSFFTVLLLNSWPVSVTEHI